MNWNMHWTPEMINEMKSTALTGSSCAAIAAHMTKKYRDKFTRNMIIGKMYREFGGIEKLKNGSF